MKEETVITKATHFAGDQPTVMTTENTITPVIPVQIGSDIEAEIAAAQHTVKETLIVEKK